ncbi:UPF0728 protein C10orf53 homolog [Genypterus blacodes]|uniref:UPF0728 protein C10orf53 homolog n=1 Tax=Genypterus blacodes TaxID=154954 RepID=UPI003F767378
MPENALVTLRYGPYESCGTVEHRTFRLQGLRAALTLHGHQCVLEETLEWNEVELLVHGQVVFKCCIKELEFGGDGKLDPLCKQAVTAVDDAY